ncbi:xanthine dehydrogenase small subunit [Paramicrobacterium chengjingii]|uniref:FAD binding domain-containing protein n=1 Tax=Paramicrobacterium chengjingii TaxID=2769067 RepID=A0ABX6YK18_9MICO|nr:FAD binding domain-containing protein [Microbacterium chengjingii]QPZ39065.1 FAD binding domain-containing protein [Microbacterium chengjingii]
MDVTVNGQNRPLSGIRAHENALDWLRANRLTGSKEGCAEGECGACAVMVANPDGNGGSTWTSVNSCLIPAAALDGQEVVTSEGLASADGLHPVQAGLAEAGGSQCGYCTPGFACSMAAEYYRADRAPCEHPADAEHGENGFDLHALSGNLCRCTGYRPIRDAAYNLGAPTTDDTLAARRDSAAPEPAATDYSADDGRFVRPAGLADALALLAQEPRAVVVAGSTDWGVDVNIKGTRVPLMVAIDRLPELRTLTMDDDAVTIGASVTLSEIERFLAGRVPLLGQVLPQFASRLIRNRATIGGNVGTGSPIGDTPPALLALDASVVLASARGEREVALAEYFTGYRQTVRADDELIRAIRIPFPLATTTAFHKIAKRRFDDISSVAIAFAVDIDGGIITRARVGLGGVAATPIRGLDTEALLVGKPWTAETARDAAASLAREGTPMSDHRASSEYRSIMLSQAVLKFFAETTEREEVGA